MLRALRKRELSNVSSTVSRKILLPLHRKQGPNVWSVFAAAAVNPIKWMNMPWRTLANGQEPTPSNAKTPTSTSSAANPNKEKKKGGGDGGEEGNDDDSAIAEQFFQVRDAVLVVLTATTIAGVLYYLSLPSGTPCGWLQVEESIADLRRIRVYDNYVQFDFIDHTTNLPQHFYCGVAKDEHTQKRVDRLVELYNALEKANSRPPLQVEYRGRSIPQRLLSAFSVIAWIAPFVFFPLYTLILTRFLMQARVESASQSSKLTKEVIFKVTKHEENSTRFNNVAGMSEVKREIVELVDFLKHPARYKRLGATTPNGALLLGPPGTGKTLLAKAIAGEAGVAFIPTCGSDFVELYVGMGSLRVRQLFKVAKEHERCIIYIDELDAVGTRRRGGGNGEDQEQEHTLNELLIQMDGFDKQEGRIMVIASTNVDVDYLDSALVRPGRFDRIIHVDAPVLAEREDIFKVHLSKLQLALPEPTTDGQTLVSAEKSAETKEAQPGDAASVSVGTVQTETPPAVVLSQNESPTVPLSTEAQAPPPTVAASVAEPAPKEGAASSPTPTTVAAAAEKSDAEKEKEEEQKKSLIAKIAARMAQLSPGFVGADIAAICNEGAILAARRGESAVTMSHLEDSVDRVIAGVEHRSRKLSEFELKVVAHHEAGHAVAGWYLDRADPLMKVSIVPRSGKALGYAQYLPNENQVDTSKDIIDSICVTLGGRVAEMIFFNHLSTGAADDLQKVTRMAYTHVCSFGSVTAHIPPGTPQTQYSKPYGERVSKRIDQQAKELVDKAFQRTFDLLTSKKADVEKLAQHLMKHEAMTHADVVSLLGVRTPSKKGH